MPSNDIFKFNYTTILFIKQQKRLHFYLRSYIHVTMKVPVNIRMPDQMKKALDKIADSEFRSLNSLILQLLDQELKSKGIKWRKEATKKKGRK